MSLSIDPNKGSDHSLRSLDDAAQRLGEASKQLSSGKRINSAADDPAGLSIATRLTAELKSLDAVQRGMQDAVSLAQTAEGALSGTSDDVARIRELAVQASNGTLSDADRSAIQAEVDQIVAGIDRTAQQTEFNGQSLLNGDIGSGSGVPVATSSDGSGETVEVDDSSAAALGVSGIDVSNVAGAQAAIDAADSAATAVQERRSALGAVENRFAAAISQVQVASENTAAARSGIEDADIAKAAANQVAARIQRDFAIAMRAQLNQNQGSVFRLLEP